MGVSPQNEKAMKQIFRKLNLAALVIVGAMAVGCTGALEEIIPNTPEETTPGIPEETQQQPESETVTLTTTISIGTETKALDAAGVKTFAVDDKIALVYKNTGGATVKVESAALTLVDITNEGRNAKFSFEVTAPDKEQDVTYIYPAAMAKSDGTVNYSALDNQDGTLETISGNLDLATYSAAWVDGTSLPSGVLENRLAIGEFTLKNFDGSSNITNTITSLTVSDGTNTYAITRSAAEGPIYVAMKPIDSGDIVFTAVGGMEYYRKSVTGKTLAAGSMYPIGVKMAFDELATPLTFEAVEAKAGVKLTNVNNYVEYSTDGLTWNAYSSGVYITLANAGDRVMFRGNKASYNSCRFYGKSQSCYIYGNVMSLLDPTGFATATTVSQNTFKELFSGNTYIRNHSFKTLALPATTLATGCYYSMFQECTGLTRAPELPATTLATSCYYSMFQGCTGLTQAPELPATTLATSCYRSMFQECTGLSQAPELPATTLGSSCYNSMFKGCTNLIQAPVVLPATTLETFCYYSMFQGCTGLATPPGLPATTLANYCYESMFQECTNLLTAPDLPATSLTDGCYRNMFNICESLTVAPALPATTMVRQCYSGMFRWCSAISEAPELPATILATECYSSMFYHCNNLTEAPVLPATTLAENCYSMMFSSCAKLCSITCLATDISASNCTYGWLGSVATDPAIGSKTFRTPKGTNWETESTSGIPTGWTRVDI